MMIGGKATLVPSSSPFRVNAAAGVGTTAVDFTGLGHVSGERIYAVFSFDTVTGGSFPASAPSGWTTSFSQTDASCPYVHVFTKISDGAETSFSYPSLTLQATATAAVRVVGTTVTTDLSSNQGVATTGNPQGVTSLTGQLGKWMLLIGFLEDDNVTLSPPSTMSLVSGTALNYASISAISMCAAEVRVPSSSFTSGSFTSSGDDGNATVRIMAP